MFPELGDAISGPGNDTRQWVSYGTVDAEEAGGKPVRFDKIGPMVDVKLHPSAAHVTCRVASWCAGRGEGEYYPFVQGDEVVVLVPEGDERAGCVIVGRCNNEIDEWPTTVAGNDPSQNNFGFRRIAVPFVTEVRQSYVVRNAVTGALWSMGADGSLTFKNGFDGFLHVGPDFVGMQASNDTGQSPVQDPTKPQLVFQLNLQDEIIDMRVQAPTKFVQLKLDPANSLLAGGGTLSVQMGGAAVAREHVITTEAVSNILTNLLIGLAAFSAPGALAGLTGAAPAVVAQALSLSGATPLNPLVSTAIAAAMVLKAPNPTGNLPAIGCPAFLAT